MSVLYPVHSELVRNQLGKESFFQDWYVEPPPHGAVYAVTCDMWAADRDGIPVRSVYAWEMRWRPGQPRLVAVPWRPVAKFDITAVGDQNLVWVKR